MEGGFVTISQNISEVLNCTDRTAITIIAITYWMRVILIPFSIVIGVTGNTLLFISMRMPAFNGTSFGVYFRVIAIVDSSILFSLLPRWLRLCGFTYFSDLTICRLLLVGVNNLYNLSNWLLVALNIDRFIRVIRPTFDRNRMKQKHAKMACSGIIVMYSVTNLLVFLVTPDKSQHYIHGGPRCGFAQNKYLPKGYVISIVYRIIGKIIPIIIIVLSSVGIYFQIKKNKNKIGIQMDDQLQLSIRIFITISFYHLLTALLNSILPLNFVNNKKSKCQSRAIHALSITTLDYLYLSNHYMKFYLLLIQTKTIRNEYKTMCARKCCCCCKFKTNANKCKTEIKRYD